uniref:Uncharacterized protein n=1 Tax=Glossina austeni TaxID=7395 RepID=A0A1A9V3L6_GLOAU
MPVKTSSITTSVSPPYRRDYDTARFENSKIRFWYVGPHPSNPSTPHTNTNNTNENPDTNIHLEPPGSKNSHKCHSGCVRVPSGGKNSHSARHSKTKCRSLQQQHNPNIHLGAPGSKKLSRMPFGSPSHVFGCLRGPLGGRDHQKRRDSALRSCKFETSAYRSIHLPVYRIAIVDCFRPIMTDWFD